MSERSTWPTPILLAQASVFPESATTGRGRPTISISVQVKCTPPIGGVVHTHSRYATAWAQAGREIPCLGTTHADSFHGPVPVTLPLRREEVEQEYEANTGHAIVRRFRELDPLDMPAVLVAGHGPFCWGPSALKAAETAVILEEVATLAFRTVALNSAVAPISEALLRKHFRRKHGPEAAYGQA